MNLHSAQQILAVIAIVLALAGTTLPAAVQAKVDGVFTALEANKAKLTAAVTANTPTPPAPTP